MDKLRILRFNVKGLGDKLKREKIFNFAKQKVNPTRVWGEGVRGTWLYSTIRKNEVMVTKPSNLVTLHEI